MFSQTKLIDSAAIRGVLLLLAVAVLASHAREPADDVWDWLTATKGKFAGIKRVLNRLHYLKMSYANSTDLDKQRRYRCVRDAIRATHQGKNCHGANFEWRNSRIAYADPYKAQLLPYLKHYRNLELNYCLPLVSARVKGQLSVLEHVPGAYKETLDAIKASVKQAALENHFDMEKLHSRLTRQVTSQGMQTFSRRQLTRSARFNRNSFMLTMNNSLVVACAILQHQFQFDLPIYYACLFDDYCGNEPLDDILKERLLEMKICSHFSRNNYRLLEEVFTAIES